MSSRPSAPLFFPEAVTAAVSSHDLPLGYLQSDKRHQCSITDTDLHERRPEVAAQTADGLKRCEVALPSETQ